MKTQGYGQFCPVAMAAEIVCSRWTLLILREMLCGSARFNDLRRGLPRLSPTLLSKRLKELERGGVIELAPTKPRGASEYRLTRAGEDLRDIIMGLGTWGQRWVDANLSLRNLDPSLLMWDMRRRLDPNPMPPRRCTIQFQFPELARGRQDYWLVVEKSDVDLCSVDPGYEIDLLVRGSLRSLTAVWMGLATVKGETDAGDLELVGDRALASTMQKWLGLSGFAKEKKLAA